MVCERILRQYSCDAIFPDAEARLVPRISRVWRTVDEFASPAGLPLGHGQRLYLSDGARGSVGVVDVIF